MTSVNWCDLMPASWSDCDQQSAVLRNT